MPRKAIVHSSYGNDCFEMESVKMIMMRLVLMEAAEWTFELVFPLGMGFEKGFALELMQLFGIDSQIPPHDVLLPNVPGSEQ